MVSNSITITVDATAPTTSNHTFSLDENVANGTAVGTVVATDSGGISSYSITAGNTSNAFAIDNNGAVTTTGAAINYEIKSNYSLTVQVADNVGNTADATVTVMINNLDEADPTIANQTLGVAENAPSNTLVGTVQASDDIGITAFAITAGNTANVFQIAGNGQLRTTTNIPGTPASYDLTVRVSDAAGKTASGHHHGKCVSR